MDFANPTSTVTALYTPASLGGTTKITVGASATICPVTPSFANPQSVAAYRPNTAGGAGSLLTVFNVIGAPDATHIVHSGPAVGFADVPLLPGDILQGNFNLQEAAFSRGSQPTLFYTYDAPEWHGLIDWNFDPILAATSGGTTAVNGTIYVMKVVPRVSYTVTNVNLIVGTAPLTPTASSNYAALYDGITGTQLGVSADQGTAWGSTGLVATALTATTTGSLALTAGRPVYVAFTNTASTAAKFAANSAVIATFADGGITTANYFRFATNGSFSSSMPASLTLSSNSHTSALAFWCGLS